MSAPRQWYYSSDGTSRFGPLTDQQLLAAVKEKLILADTLVWHAELSGWLPAARIKALFPAAQAARISASAANRQRNSEAAEKTAQTPASNGSSAAAPRKKSTRRVALVVFAIIAILTCGGSYLATHRHQFERLAAIFAAPEKPSALDLEKVAVATAAEQQQTPLSQELSDEQRRTLALAAIDELAAHPDDPHKPENVAGVTDDDLRSTSLIEVAELLELCTPYAYEERGTPRYLFALGRAALLHGMDSRAERLLTDATEGGSIPAHAYLAFLTHDPKEAAGRLNLAIIRGFLPAKAWLVELGDPAVWANTEVEGPQSGAPTNAPEKDKQDAPPVFSYTLFKRPDLIKAFHTGNFDILPPKKGLTCAYILGFLEAFNDTSSMPRTSSEAAEKLHSLQDPQFVYEASLIIAGDGEFLDEAMEHTFGSFVGAIKGMADVRRRGGSLQEETGAAIRGAGAISKVDIAKAEGRHDARALGFLIAANFSDAKQVMDGLRNFVVRVGEGERFGARNETPSGSFGGVSAKPSRGSGRGSPSTLPGGRSGRGSR